MLFNCEVVKRYQYTVLGALKTVHVYNVVL